MLRKLLTIAKNTFVETLRQPIFAIIVFIAILVFIISPSITMFSIDDDNKLLKELSFSTLFLAGLFIAVFSAIGAITEELDSKTILTVLAKPVPRWVFVIGKFLGIVSAVGLAHLASTMVMMLSLRHGVLESARDEIDMTVVTIGVATITISLLISTIMNYTYGWSFSATCTGLLAVLSTIGVGVLCFIDRDWKFNPAENNFAIFDTYASILVFLAVILLVSVAIMFSTRFNIVMTLILCASVFLLGLVSDYIFGRYAEIYIWAKAGRILLPNLQVFWISDAIYEESTITVGYIAKAALYSISYTVGMLGIATAMFQSKQVGKQ